MSPDFVAWAIFKAILVLGFALWTMVAALNNITGFRGAAAAISGTMGMVLLNGPPAVVSPLTRRALTSPRLAALSLVLILVVQIAAALALGLGGALLLADGIGAGVPEWGGSGRADRLYAPHKPVVHDDDRRIVIRLLDPAGRAAAHASHTAGRHDDCGRGDL